MTSVTEIFSIAPLEWLGLLCAVVGGGIIGIERQVCGKPVGIRTSALICVGAYVFVSVANTVSNGSTDSSRIIGQVVTGVGFLGAGVMMARDGIVIGVTSAATIWVQSAIGILIASGYYLSGIKLSLFTVAILVGVNMLERTFKLLQRGVHQQFVQVRNRRRKLDFDPFLSVSENGGVAGEPGAKESDGEVRP
ncbi:MAG: MgtC/SapB family protein [Desulfuromonadales bacterium]|nr:MgtC/SapB family protein [Desulfuromonadales bacterium]